MLEVLVNNISMGTKLNLLFSSPSPARLPLQLLYRGERTRSAIVTSPIQVFVIWYTGLEVEPRHSGYGKRYLSPLIATLLNPWIGCHHLNYDRGYRTQSGTSYGNPKTLAKNDFNATYRTAHQLIKPIKQLYANSENFPC